ncbi:MAG: peptidoglycan editing factor PgeF [Rickettsiales bacterium]
MRRRDSIISGKMVYMQIKKNFFTRNGGVSKGEYASLAFMRKKGLGDNFEDYQQNLRIVAAHFGDQRLPVKHLDQNHTNKVVHITAADMITDEIEADGLVTTLPNIVLGVITGDCCPIVFEDNHAKVIGACHAGWKGAIAGIIENTIAAMVVLGADKKNIHATIGPTIGQKSYEVDANFRDQFLDQSPANASLFIDSVNEGRYMFDLPGYCARRLATSGLLNISDVGEDTYSQPEKYFSFRRSTHEKKAIFGCQMSAVMLAG